jgi:hypothetical protein
VNLFSRFLSPPSPRHFPLHVDTGVRFRGQRAFRIAFALRSGFPLLTMRFLCGYVRTLTTAQSVILFYSADLVCCFLSSSKLRRYGLSLLR